MANFVSNDDALEVLDKYAKGIKKGIGVVAVRETSPAAAAHAVGDYIRYSGTVYKVKSAISIGDSLILNTNIEAHGLPNDTTIYTPGLDEENLSGLSNKNLIDNPFFTINERGLSSYSDDTGYTVDRFCKDSPWGSGGPVAVSASGITFQGKVFADYPTSYSRLSQILNNASDLIGKTVTISALVTAVTADSEGDYPSISQNSASGYSGEFLSLNKSGIISKTFTWLSGYDRVSIIVPNGASSASSISLRAVKLELGSVSTLANDVAPDYATELAKCQTSTADPNDTYANQGQLMTSALQGVYGSKNLLNISVTSQERHSVTCTVNANKTITLDGTADGASDWLLFSGAISDQSTPMILSGCPDGGSDSTYLLQIYDATNGASFIGDFGNGLTFNYVAGHVLHVYLSFRSGVVFNNSVFKPMIRDARIKDATYAPYAMTNRELTEKLIAENIKDASVTGTISLYKTGNFKILKINDVRFPSPYLPVGESQTIGTIPSGYRPAALFVFSTFQTIRGQYIASPIVLSTDGTISFTNLGSAETAGYLRTCIVYI